MAHVWKQKKSRFWTARFKDGTGKWVNRSTVIPAKPTTRKKAEEMALEWERIASGTADVSVTEAHVAKVARGLAQKISPEQFREETIAEFFHAFLLAKEKDVELGTLNRTTLHYYSSVVNNFLPWLGERGKRSFKTMKPPLFDEYRDNLMGQGKGANTVSKYLKVLRTPLNEATNKGRLEMNPAKAVKLPAATASKRKPFDKADIGKMLKTLKGEWRTIFLVGLYTGARLGDCVRMRWEMVDIFNGTMTFVQRKTKRKNPGKLVIPLHDTLWAHLKSIRKDAGLIVPGLAAKVGAHDATDDDGVSSPLSLEFGELMDAAGVSQESVISPTGRKVSAKSFHSLRHTINTALNRQAKVGEEVRSRLTGHKLKGMNQHYTHTEVEEVRAALKLVSFVV